jgi:hypothetical protein
MAETRRPKEEKVTCDVEGCGADAQRSVHGKKVEKSGLRIRSDPAKNAHLCRDHYREFKKKTKKDRMLERLGR